MTYLVYRNGIGSHPWWVVGPDFLTWVAEHGFYSKPEEFHIIAYCQYERPALLLRNALEAEVEPAAPAPAMPEHDDGWIGE